MTRVVPGQPLNISAATWNAIQDLVEQALKNRGLGLSDPLQGNVPPGYVRVINSSGQDREAFDLLALGGGLHTITPSDSVEMFLGRQSCLEGSAPTRPGHIGKFCVLPRALKDGAIGLAMVSGIIKTKINVTHAAHRFADIKSGEYRLESGYVGGAEIIARDSGTGDKWGFVRIGSFHSPVLRGRLTQKLTYRKSATVRVTHGDLSGGTVTWSDGASGEDVTVVDSLLRPDMLLDFVDPENFVEFVFDRTMGQFKTLNWSECSVEDDDPIPE